MNSLSSSIFLELDRKKQEIASRGADVINLSIGTPDTPPAAHIMRALEEACREPENMKYAVTDLPELVGAVAGWYARRYGVALEPDEILGMGGSQEGLSHIALALCDPGDWILVPDPGYPIFQNGSHIASARAWHMPLREECGYLPDLGAIPEEIARKARLMVLSYPMNPLGALAPEGFFDEVIAFAKKYDIVVLHDNAYSEIVFDGRRCGSFLAHEGAKDVGIEFNSLSKSYNLTGARISFALGNRDVIAAYRNLKSHMDYGVFRPVQRAAVAALTGPQDCVRELCALYESRRDALVESFGAAGWPITPPEATLFVWARLPEGHTDSMRFCMELADRTGVLAVPGIAFGEGGEGYARIALVRDEAALREAARRIRESGMLR
ncbi:aminotransferase class I/II-fold pyridoxal phosphate-dependent enzyme [Feifania hominis]|uniref:Aminotransferase class I/II-fold pyridoxal phosphate-dependent enzyme n=1 Tax=Feifania hominis TaxID=2763660 RepID=A0A926DGB1_9FIRM|nr:aminotransferase class I/II-fold pyridoxal phosphate-dependent enzyme [Feifania hominis]MBC8536520.1 aminotransferase class I/II-fold pyridoxal phosphate-dependent enzyme [Feifania hominis]